METSYSNQNHTLALADVEWVVESQLQFTELGPEGQLGARYTPWIFENAEYITKGKQARVTIAWKHHMTDHSCEIDSDHQKCHKFNLNTPDDHLIDTVLEGVKIAEGIFDKPGKLQVNHTTATNYTVPGLG